MKRTEVHYFLAAYQRILEGIIFRLEKGAKLDTQGWQEVIRVMT